MAGTTLRRILLWVVLSVPSLDAYSQIVLRRNPLLEHSAPPSIISIQIPTVTLHSAPTLPKGRLRYDYASKISGGGFYRSKRAGG